MKSSTVLGLVVALGAAWVLWPKKSESRAVTQALAAAQEHAAAGDIPAAQVALQVAQAAAQTPAVQAAISTAQAAASTGDVTALQGAIMAIPVAAPQASGDVVNPPALIPLDAGTAFFTPDIPAPIAPPAPAGAAIAAPVFNPPIMVTSPAQAVGLGRAEYLYGNYALSKNPNPSIPWGQPYSFTYSPLFKGWVMWGVADPTWDAGDGGGGGSN